MLKLYPFQEDDAEWVMRQNSLLADACGLGKTIIAVEAAKRYAQGPILVVAPRLTKLWWAQTIRDQEAGYVGVCGPAGRGIPWKKVAAWKDRRPLIFVIVHPEAVRIAVDKLRKIQWDTIIVDEAHRFKNRKAAQTKALWRLRARKKVLLTATPYGRSPADMWALLHYLYPKDYRSYWRFFDKYTSYYQPPGKYWKQIHGPKNLDGLASEVSGFYRSRKKEEVLDLPPLSYADVPVLIHGAQEKLYMQLVRDSYAELVGKEIILENVLVKFVRLQQCALDPSLMSQDLSIFPLNQVPAKVSWLEEWLSDHPTEPVVIVSRFRTFVEKWLRDLAPKATIVGGMSQKDIKAVLKIFERTGRLVGSLDAVKEGLNLQRASTLIVTDGSWSVTAEYQLSQRIHRIGSKKPCQVIHLVGVLATSRKWTVDKLMRRALDKRLSAAAMLNEFIKELQTGGAE